MTPHVPRLVLRIACLAFCFTGSALFAGASRTDTKRIEKVLASSGLTPDQQIVHVLNRLCFGPRPGDVEKIKVEGLPAFISEQLHPENIDDSSLSARLRDMGGMDTLNMSAAALAEAARAEKAEGQGGNGVQKGRQPILQRSVMELQRSKLLRAVYSERQLLEVMTDFWFNHFNVFIGKGQDRILIGEYERDVIRRNALGKFHDLLEATAKSPAMLFYLDNWLSVDPDAPVFRRQPKKQARGLNENYARELMELHTLGVDGGYTQKDVTEVARCFTGWTLRNPVQGGGFVYRDDLHDHGSKVVLGTEIQAGGGINDGEHVLDLLSRHPSTATFISQELCRRFVSDYPPTSLVRRCAETFRKSDGDIRQVLEVIFSSPEFFSRAAYRAKIKSPFEMVASALRATGAETTVPPRILLMLRNMGEALYGCQPPAGYPDVAEGWVSTDSLLERMTFAGLLASNRIPQTRVNLPTSDTTAGVDISLIGQVSQALLQVQPEPELLSLLKKQLSATGETTYGTDVSAIAAVVIGSPTFQRR